jgi:hypothetical protein
MVGLQELSMMKSYSVTLKVNVIVSSDTPIAAAIEARELLWEAAKPARFDAGINKVDCIQVVPLD